MSTNRLIKFNSWLNIVQFCLLPGVCVLCNRATGRQADLCLPCQHALPLVPSPCPACGLPLPPGLVAGMLCGNCQHKRRIFRTVAPLQWHATVIPLVSGFKYRQQLHCGKVLGQVLQTHIRQAYSPEELPQLLLPVPLHPTRLQERGYNQALLLARQLGAAFNIEVNHGLLRRTRSTPPQQGLNARQRKTNLQGAFKVHNPAALAGISRLALVDDVVTTMTTVRVIARQLQRSARAPLQIHVWALARA